MMPTGCKGETATVAATLMRGVEASLNPEFQIQNEDFPALPGASPGDHPAQAPASLVRGHSLFMYTWYRM
ncbi:hypothetical protein Aduo_004082 [Ancylostoma duodenale]